MLSKERNMSIDVIKIIAMLGVIMLHTTHDFMYHDGLDIASFMYKSSVISIPLFFMSSGYLLLGRNNITYNYTLKKIIGILRYMAFFCVCYWLIKQNFTFNSLWNIFWGSFNVEGPFFVFWYFGAMIIIYLLLPFINYIYLYFKKAYYLSIIFLLVIQNIIFSYNSIIGIETAPAALRLYNWLTYFMLGGGYI